MENQSDNVSAVKKNYKRNLHALNENFMQTAQEAIARKYNLAVDNGRVIDDARSVIAESFYRAANEATRGSHYLSLATAAAGMLAYSSVHSTLWSAVSGVAAGIAICYLEYKNFTDSPTTFKQLNWQGEYDPYAHELSESAFERAQDYVETFIKGCSEDRTLTLAL